MWETPDHLLCCKACEVIRQDAGNPEVIQSNREGCLRKVIKRRKALEEDLKKKDKI